MNHINFREQNSPLADLVDKVNQSKQATLITINNQQQAVLVSVEEWEVLQETINSSFHKKG